VIKSIKILLIEDNPGDIRLTLEALKEGRISNEVTIAKDGQQALDCLYGRGGFVGCTRPDIILLDLNLPKIDGREILRIIKSDDDLKTIPVIIMTTSRAEEDVLRSYNLHANCYVTKPIDMDQFIGAIRLLEDLWLSIVVLPTRTFRE
jgi:CheY-like chemotaxis protein